MCEDFSDDSIKQCPRKLGFEPEVEEFLTSTISKHVEASQSTRDKSVRPNANNENAIRCAACGQVEYITREYCRCGHYLAGQIEDEYIAWEKNLIETHEFQKKELSRRMKPYGIVKIFPLIAPITLYTRLILENEIDLQLLFGLTLLSCVIPLPFALKEKSIMAELGMTQDTLDDTSFERYLNERLNKNN